MSQLYKLWNTTSAIPVVGKRIFSLAFSQKAPYFGSIHPRVRELRPNYAEVLVPNRRSNHNHIGTVHAIAVCNGFEMAMGALAEVTIPDGKRWIPMGMDVRYTAKSTSDIVCTAETEQQQWDEADGELQVRVTGTRDDGTVVAEGVIKLWVTPKK
jgi:acyl-coenzyme A thioesterase PaaI-like protein